MARRIMLALAINSQTSWDTQLRIDKCLPKFRRKVACSDGDNDFVARFGTNTFSNQQQNCRNPALTLIQTLHAIKLCSFTQTQSKL